jgi:branched-chain amino acid transport system ATP-binding protein
MLDAKGIRSGYHGVEVIKGLDLSVGHEVFAILGANGAGKSTLLATLARLIPLMDGEIWFQGENISHVPSWVSAERGIGYVPQEKGIFPDLTVLENLYVGAMIGRRSREERLEEVIQLFPDIKERRGQLAGTLSGGESRMVACARALMQDPKLLLLDEPTAGMSLEETGSTMDLVDRLNSDLKLSVLFTEHDMSVVFNHANRVTLLHRGEIIVQGAPDQVRNDPTAQKIYLGEHQI